jgi:hypothetical protein
MLIKPIGEGVPDPLQLASRCLQLASRCLQLASRCLQLPLEASSIGGLARLVTPDAGEKIGMDDVEGRRSRSPVKQRNSCAANRSAQYPGHCSLTWPSPPCPGIAAEKTTTGAAAVSERTRGSAASAGRCSAVSRQRARSKPRSSASGRVRLCSWNRASGIASWSRGTQEPSTPRMSVTPLDRRAASHRPVPQPISMTLFGAMSSMMRSAPGAADRATPSSRAWKKAES